MISEPTEEQKKLYEPIISLINKGVTQEQFVQMILERRSEESE